MAKVFEKGLNSFNNVSVGKNFTSETSYIIGYWEAGDLLVDMAITTNNPQRDRLFLPICYNYRHFLELNLKYLILEAEELYYLLEKENMQNKDYKNNFSNEINNTHNINKLLNWLLIILACISDDKFSKAINKLIFEFHKIDETGQTFRYLKSKDDIIHFKNREEFDLEKIKNAVYKIGNYLMGIDIYLSEHSKFIKAFICEMESNYNWEYEHQDDYYYNNYY